MSHPVIGIDHCYLLVDDLDASLAAYRKLGFTVSPRGLHSAHMGSANHTIMLQNDYFELLGMVAATDFNTGRRKLLAESGQGLHAVACRAGNVDEAEKELSALGIATTGRRDFERPVPLPAGGEAPAAFSVLEFESSEVPVGLAFMCQHHTPETVWLPELMTHANGATALGGLIAMADAPKAAAERLARLFAAGRVDPVEGGHAVNTGTAPITVLNRDALAARYPDFNLNATARGAYAALQVTVDDLATPEKTLASNGVKAHRTATGLAVAPEDASGAIVEFMAR